jgi:mRNA-degrading endonuclease RelE of RelBE toxin-antitoxin system
MTYRVIVSPPARRDVARLPMDAAVAVLELCEGPLADNPYRIGKPLILDLSGFHAARRGEYRVIYKIDEKDETVTVVKVSHRRDAYRPR